MKFTTSLKKNHQFRTAYNRGKSYKNRFLVLNVLDNHLEINRIGITVSKKIGNSVVRHRVTRLIKESYRLSETELKYGRDIVVIARQSAADKSFAEINEALCSLLCKASIYRA